MPYGMTLQQLLPRRYYRIWDEYACCYGDTIILARDEEDALNIYRAFFSNPDNIHEVGEDYTAQEVFIFDSYALKEENNDNTTVTASN